jgi:hypothetical protein
MRTHTHNPSRFAQRLLVLVVMISFWPAGTCLAQEQDLDLSDSLSVSDAEETSPQEKAAQAAEAAQRRQEQLLGQRQMKQQQVAEQLEQQRAMLEQQLSELEAKRAYLAQQMSQLQSQPQMMMNLLRGQQNAPLPRDGTFKVFSLRNSRAADAARILSEILGGAVTRMAVDERTNSLLVFGDEDTMKIVEGLALKLDERSDQANIEIAQPGETLQLRIVWLLDGVDDGMDPTDQLVSPEVVDALHGLGFATPRVVCQQVTTLTLSHNRGRSGEFNYAVPVLINSQPWHFEGHGQIESMAEERFNLRFDLKFQQRIDADGKRMGQEGQLGGSIYTPLGHYTVMGTTTFVAVIPNESIQQHLSAFVVYLDRAREFPAAAAPANNRTDVRP